MLIIIPLLFNAKNIIDFKNFNNQSYHNAKITQIYANSIFVKEDGETYYLFISDASTLEAGDKISFEGNYQKYQQQDLFQIFLLSHQTVYYLYPTNLQITKSKDNFRNTLFTKLKNDNSLYSQYALAMLYKYKTSTNSDAINQINDLGISYLIVISGFHISLLFIFTEKFLNKFIKNQWLIFIAASGLSFFFLYLIYFPPAGLRAWIYQNIHKGSKLSKVNALSVTGIIMLFLNPFNVLSISLILSFLITYLILIVQKSKLNNKQKKLIIATYAFVVANTFIILWDSTFNLFAPILSLILTPIISYLYVIILLFLPFPFLWIYLTPFFVICNYILNFIFKLYFPIKLLMISLPICVTLLSIEFFILIRWKNRFTFLMLTILAFFAFILLLNL